MKRPKKNRRDLPTTPRAKPRNTNARKSSSAIASSSSASSRRITPAPDLTDTCPKCGHEYGEHNGKACPKLSRVVRGPQVEAFNPSSYVAPSSWAPPPARSANQREGDVGNKIVVSVRLRRELVAKLDEEVEAAAGSYPPVTRNELVRIAIEELLLQLSRERAREGRAA